MKTIASLILVLLTAQPAMAASYKLDVKDSKPFYQTNVPLEIYKQTHYSNLSDLTISNAAGEQVPYALVPYEQLNPDTTNRTESIALPFSPVKTKALQSAGTLQLALEKSATATSIKITTNEAKPIESTVFLIDLGTKFPPIKRLLIDWQGGENTLHNIQILSSPDLKNWTFAGDATLLSTLQAGDTPEEQLQQLKNLTNRASNDENAKAKHNISQHYIKLNNNWNIAGDARYLQIRPSDDNDTGTIAITKVQALYNVLQTVEETPLWQAPRLISRELEEKTGLINIDFESLGHYPASRYKVWLPQANTVTYVTIFARNSANEPWKQVSYEELRRHKESEPFSSVSIITPIDARYWQLQFNQAEGGIGAESPTLYLGWLAPTIVWNARGQAPFTLTVGEKPSIVNTIPIATMLPNYSTQTINNLPLANLIMSNQDAANAPAASTWVAPRDYKTWLLWGGLMLGVLLLAGMAYSLLKSERKQ